MHSAAGSWMSRHLHASPTWAPSRVGGSTTRVPIIVAVERVPVADRAVSHGGCGRPISSAILGFARVTIAGSSHFSVMAALLLARSLHSPGSGDVQRQPGGV